MSQIKTTFENVAKSIYNNLSDEDKKSIFEYSPQARDSRIINKIIDKLSTLATKQGNTPDALTELFEEKHKISINENGEVKASSATAFDNLMNHIQRVGRKAQGKDELEKLDEQLASGQVQDQQATSEANKITFKLKFSVSYMKQIHDLPSDKEKIEVLKNEIDDQLKAQMDEKVYNKLINMTPKSINSKGVLKNSTEASNTQSETFLDFFAKFYASSFSEMNFDKFNELQAVENKISNNNGNTKTSSNNETEKKIEEEQKKKKEARMKEAKENISSGSIESIQLDDVLNESDLTEIINKKPEERYPLIKNKIVKFFSDKTNAFSIEGAPIDFDGKFTDKEKSAINGLASNFETDIKEIAEKRANNDRIHMESLDLVDELEAEFARLKPQLETMAPAQRKFAIEKMVLKVCTGMGNNLTLDYLRNFKPNGMNIKLPGISPTQLKNIQNLNLVEFLVRYYNIKATHNKMDIQQVKDDVAELIPEAIIYASPASSITSIGSSVLDELTAPEKVAFEFDENILRKIRYKTEPLTTSEQNYMDAYNEYKKEQQKIADEEYAKQQAAQMGPNKSDNEN